MIMELAIGSVVLAVAYMLYVIFTFAKIRSTISGQEDREAARMLDKENRNRIMKNITGVTKTFNLKTIIFLRRISLNVRTWAITF